MKRSAAAFAVAVTGLLLTPRFALANVGEAFGFGSRTGGLAGAGVSLTDDAYAAYTNPASLGTLPFHDKSVLLSWGVMDMEPIFKPISGVVIENTYNSDQTRTGDVDTSYRSTFGQFLSVAFRPWPETASLTLGIVSFIPINQIAYMDTGETYIPEYFLYRARTQRPQFEFGAGGELASSGVSVGVGLHLAFSLTSNASLFLNSESGKPSSMRFIASMKPKLAPYAGFLFSPHSDPEKMSAGIVVRMPVASANKMTLSTNARVFGGLTALPFNFQASSALFYDPLTLEMGASWQHTRLPTWRARFVSQLNYEMWHSFEPPMIEIIDPKITCDPGAACGISISPTLNPAYPYRNILIPRFAEELTVGATTFRLGYAYQPSILDGIPTGAGNYLDPSKHIITLGTSFVMKAATVDVHLAYHQMVTQSVTKTPGDEAGNGTGNLKIGAPGYEAGGKILGGGLSLSVSL